MKIEDIKEIIRFANNHANSSDEQKQIYDLFNQDISFKNVYKSLIKSLIQWRYHQLECELQQEFEICAQIEECKQFEVDETIRLLSTYLEYTDEEVKMIAQIKEKAQIQADLSFEAYKKL
jgi:hypothetical protein